MSNTVSSNGISRRKLLKLAGVGGALVALGKVGGLSRFGLAQAAETTPAEQIVSAAQKFLAGLTEAQRADTALPFEDSIRQNWGWTPAYPRRGVSIREMNDDQRALADGLLRASLSEGGHKKSLDIMALQADLNADPTLFYWTIYGTPDASETWGWRVEGHHLSTHFTMVKGQLVIGPMFLGAWPTDVKSGPCAGLKAMATEEEAARELLRSLDERKRALAYTSQRPGTDILTRNARAVEPLKFEGIALSELDEAQVALAVSIIEAYVTVMPDALATARMAAIRKSLGEIRFAYQGSDEPLRPHAYQLQGPDFLIDYNNTRNGATHIHSVYRAFTEDFGKHLL